MNLPKSWELSKQDTSMEFLEIKVIFSEFISKISKTIDQNVTTDCHFIRSLYVKLLPKPFQVQKTRKQIFLHRTDSSTVMYNFCSTYVNKSVNKRDQGSSKNY